MIEKLQLLIFILLKSFFLCVAKWTLGKININSIEILGINAETESQDKSKKQ